MTTVSNALHSRVAQETLARLVEMRDRSAVEAQDVIEQNQILAAQELTESITDLKVPYSERYKNCRWIRDAGGKGAFAPLKHRLGRASF